MLDKIAWTPVWSIHKFYNQDDFEHDVPYAVSRFEGNLLLTTGAAELLKLLTGDTATAFTNAVARLGVGDDSTAANAAQTGLIGTGVYVGMDATYPQVADNVLTARSTFDGTTANASWQEFSLDNGAVGAVTLNRKVSDQGTKTAGQVWVLTLTITLS